LNNECNRLGKEVQLLQSRVGKGDFDSNKFKILHMKENPASMKKTEQLNAKIVLFIYYWVFFL
jgi:hypothetical protein